MSRSRAASWNVFFHYVSIGMMFVSGVVLVPYYLRFISPTLYGAWLASGNVLVWITGVDPGISIIVQQRVGAAVGGKRTDDVGQVIASGILLSAALSLVMVSVGLLIASHVPGWIGVEGGATVSSEISRAFSFAVVGGGLMLLSYTLTAANQGFQLSMSIGLVYTTVHAVSLLLTIVLLQNGFGVMAIAYGYVWRGIGMLLGNSLVLAMTVIAREVKISVTRKMVVSTLSLLSVTSFSRILILIAENMESVLVARFLGVEHVTQFSLTKKTGNMVKMLSERPTLAIMPQLSHLYGEGRGLSIRAVQLTEKLTVAVIGVIIWAVVGLVAFNEAFVSLWVGPDLYAGSPTNIFLACGVGFIVLSGFFRNTLIASGNIRSMSLVGASAAAGVIVTAVTIRGTLGSVGIAMAISLPHLVLGVILGAILFFRFFPLDLKSFLPTFGAQVLIAVGFAVSVSVFFSASKSWFWFFILTSTYSLTYWGLFLIMKPGFRRIFKKIFSKILLRNRITR